MERQMDERKPQGLDSFGVMTPHIMMGLRDFLYSSWYTQFLCYKTRECFTQGIFSTKNVISIIDEEYKTMLAILEKL